MFAAKQIYLGRCAKAAPTAKSYVQDGLIVQLDGIENSGYGVHDANATVWKSLVGNYSASGVSGNFSWGDNALLSANVAAGAGLGFGVSIPSFNYMTMEICYDAQSGSRYLVDSGFGNQFAILSRDGAYLQFTSYRGIVKSSAAMYGQHCISYVYSGNSANSAYENGSPATLSSISNSWNPGSWSIGTKNSRYNGFRGKMHSYRLYSRALTAAEIAANYAIDKERFNLP